jgi:hypothetical protein
MAWVLGVFQLSRFRVYVSLLAGLVASAITWLLDDDLGPPMHSAVHSGVSMIWGPLNIIPVLVAFVIRDRIFFFQDSTFIGAVFVQWFVICFVTMCIYDFAEAGGR